MDTVTIGAFVVGMTQIIKDYSGIRGEYLKFVAIALGGIAAYLTQYYPELWSQISTILLAVGATGSVSFMDERLNKIKAVAPNGQ